MPKDKLNFFRPSNMFFFLNKPQTMSQKKEKNMKKKKKEIWKNDTRHVLVYPVSYMINIL